MSTRPGLFSDIGKKTKDLLTTTSPITNSPSPPTVNLEWHLDNQKELLMDAYRSMSHELHKLQVEEEMLMRKYHEFMTAQGFISEKKYSTGVQADVESSEFESGEEES